MNKVFTAVNVILVAAVAFLFYKVYSCQCEVKEDEKSESSGGLKKDSSRPESRPLTAVATVPTGKIAYVNIDRLNEESAELSDLIAEANASKSGIENSVQALREKYATKMEEYQRSAKAGIAPQSQLDALEKEIHDIENEAQKKQMQMDNLSERIAQKNMDFQQGLKDFLVKWNDGRYDYIFSYSDNMPTMLLGNASLDVTKEVIEKVNEEYKTKKASKKQKK
jgi:outer membrane protein